MIRVFKGEVTDPIGGSTVQVLRSPNFTHPVQSGAGVGASYVFNHNSGKVPLSFWVERLDGSNWQWLAPSDLVQGTTRYGWSWNSSYTTVSTSTVGLYMARIGSSSETIRIAVAV